MFHYITDVESANYFISQLKGRAIGFDAEWKPNWVKGAPENRVSLVQLADESAVLLIHVSAMGWQVPLALKTMLEDETISKSGVGIRGDADKIRRDHGVVMAGCIDLSQLALSLDQDRWTQHQGMNLSLAKLTETYVKHFLEKPRKLQRGNWERPLSMEMQEYAANDAASGLSIYLALEELRMSLPGPPSLSEVIEKAKRPTPSGPMSKLKYREKAPSIDSGVDSSSESTAVLTATITDATVHDSDSPRAPSPSDTPKTQLHPLPSNDEQPLASVAAALTLLDRLEKAGSPTPSAGSKRFSRRRRAKTFEGGDSHGLNASPLSSTTVTRNQPRRPNKRTKA